MKKHFTIKSVLITLLVMISYTMKTEIFEYITDDGFAYNLDTENQEASLRTYEGYATEIVIPKSITYKKKAYKVTNLRSRCFYCRAFLTSIKIPASVTSLGYGCFGGCSSLNTVMCRKEEEIEWAWLFGDSPIIYATLYVPKELLDTYKFIDSWKFFGTILPLTDGQVSVAETPELGIALNTNNVNVVVSGFADDTLVSCYTLDGRMLSKTSTNGSTATFTAEPNSIVIVKAGKNSFKAYVT